MQINKIIAFDVSKLTLNYCVHADGKFGGEGQIENTTEAIAELVGRLAGQAAPFDGTLFCLEWTGVYGSPLMEWLGAQGAAVWAEGGVQIRRSQGLVRGKSDPIDARGIALYAWRNRDKARLWKPLDKALNSLKQMMAARSLLVRQKASLQTALGEQAAFLGEDYAKAAHKALEGSGKAIQKEIAKLELAMKELIKADSALGQLYRIVASVEGVGFVTAVTMIVTTGGFKVITDGRKYACYCGVVPFAQESGTSVRKRPKVSHFADKDAKKNIHMGAMAAVQSESGEMRGYYLRKVEEGKNKLSVLNAVRNKIVRRVFACVREGKMYERQPVRGTQPQVVETFVENCLETV